MIDMPEHRQQNSHSTNHRSLVIAQEKLKQFRSTLQSAINKYKSTITYGMHEKKSKKTGITHPRLTDVNELQNILDNADYTVSLKNTVLGYIDDPKHFQWSKLSPLRRYMRIAINSYLKMHNVEYMELTDAILAMTSSAVTEEDSDTQTVEEPNVEIESLNSQLQNTRLQLQTTQQAMRQLNEEKKLIGDELDATRKAVSETKGLLVNVEAARDLAISEKRQMHFEKDQQAHIINQQSNTIRLLKDRIQDLKVSIETFQQAAAETISSLYDMFTTLSNYFYNALNDKPRNRKNSTHQQNELLYGEKFREQVRKECRPIVKGGGGPVHSLVTELKDPNTGRGLKEDILPNYMMYAEKLEQAVQLCDQTDNVMLSVTTTHAAVVQSLENSPVGSMSIAPPPPPPPPLTSTPTKKTTTPIKTSATKPSQEQEVATASAPRINPNDLAAAAEARAKRLAEGKAIRREVVQKNTPQKPTQPSFFNNSSMDKFQQREASRVASQEALKKKLASIRRGVEDEWDDADMSPNTK